VFFVLDVDHFKRVNDTFGHAAGDHVLAQVARALQAGSRASDVVARWGGEEFLVVSRFVDRRQAPATAERIRAAVAAHATRLPDGRTVRVTCSIGFAALPGPPETPFDWEQAVALADRASYAAKRAGRDGWVGYAAGPDASMADALLEPLDARDALDGLAAAGRLWCVRSAARAAAPVP
jgi:diguanylate cyclase (GGDEF)-like protein